MIHHRHIRLPYQKDGRCCQVIVKKRMGMVEGIKSIEWLCAVFRIKLAKDECDTDVHAMLPSSHFERLNTSLFSLIDH